MTKKEKDPLEEYQKLKDEMIGDQLAEIFRTGADNWRTALEEIGFQ
jgi:hypothetical protein